MIVLILIIINAGSPRSSGVRPQRLRRVGSSRYCALQYYTILIILYYTILYYTILYYTILYCPILHYIILYI